MPSEKAALLAEADAAMARVKLGCDLIIGMRLLDVKPHEQRRALLNSLLMNSWRRQRPIVRLARKKRWRRRAHVRAFHWPFEFPEVFLHDGEVNAGFDAFVGNPPFIGGTAHQRDAMAMSICDYLQDNVVPNSAAQPILCAYFFLRGFEHLQSRWHVGLDCN